MLYYFVAFLNGAVKFLAFFVALLIFMAWKILCGFIYLGSSFLKGYRRGIEKRRGQAK